MNLNVTRLKTVFLPQRAGTVFVVVDGLGRRTINKPQLHNKELVCANADHRYFAIDSGVAIWFCGRLWSSRVEIASKTQTLAREVLVWPASDQREHSVRAQHVGSRQAAARCLQVIVDRNKPIFSNP
jgi:hypothetical protein